MLKKNDFVEIDFIGRIKGSGIFDTTKKETAKEAGIDDSKCQPMKICVGQRMLIKGFDDALEGKELGKEYKIELLPKDAFGERDSSLLKTVPLRMFTEKGISPQQGMIYSFDNALARISSVTGGRVTIDFNNPLAGKNIVYDFTVNRLIEDMKEKVSIVIGLFLPFPNPEIRINGKNATLVLPQKLPEQIFELIKNKVKELLDVELSLEVKEIKEKSGKADEIKKENKKIDEHNKE